MYEKTIIHVSTVQRYDDFDSPANSFNESPVYFSET